MMRAILIAVLLAGCTADSTVPKRQARPHTPFADVAASGDLALASVDDAGDAPDLLPAADGGDFGGAGSSVDFGTGDGPDLACYPHSVACGRCGMAAGTCSGGSFVVGACGSEGPCTPGDQQISADGCSVQVCTAGCQWPGWSWAGDSTCSTGMTRSCVSPDPNCPHAGTQTCTSCKWGGCAC